MSPLKVGEMSFITKLKEKKFVWTLELEPPKGVDVETILKKIAPLQEKIDAFNVTDMQAANMRMSSWAMCVRLKQTGYEPILQLTARDRNILALQGDLLGSSMLGVENVLLLTGDSPSGGDHPQAKGVFDIDSIQMISTASQLNCGLDYAGNSLESRPNLFIGAALNPFAADIDKELERMEKKIKAGVSFFQTQPIFDVERFGDFVNRAKPSVPILAGIIFLKSPRMARYLNEKVAGIDVPQKYIDRLEKSSSTNKQEAMAIAKEIIVKLKGLCAGVHFMPFGWYEEVEEIISKI